MRVFAFMGKGCLLALWVMAPTANALAQPVDPPTHIRVATDNNYPPYLYLDTSGKPQGYEVDMWKLFEKHTGIQVELQPMSWMQAQQALLSGQADVIDMIYRTPARERLYDFGPAYGTNLISIYVDRRIRGVHDIASLHGFPVGVERGDACVQHLRAKGITDLRLYTGYRDIINAVKDDSLRIFCMDESPASYYLYRYSKLGNYYKAFVLYTGHVHRAVRKGNTGLLSVVEQGMAKITPAEKAALRDRWLEQPVILWPYLRMARIAGAIVLVLAVLVALWIWLLRRAVTRRTRAIEAGRATLQAVLDGSPYAMWVKDRDGVHREHNERMAEVFALDTPYQSGGNDAQLMGEAMAVRLKQIDEEVLRSGTLQTSEMELLASDGSARRLEFVEVPLRLPDGKISGVLSSAHDVTEQAHAQAELRLAAATFSAQEALVVMDAEHRIQRVNRAFEALAGFADHEVLGKTCEEVCPVQGERAEVRSFWQQVDQSGSGQSEQWVQVKDGEPKLVRLTVSSVSGEGGATSHYVCSLVDLTAEREARESLQRMTYFDPVTNLPNRHFLQGRLHQLLEEGEPHNEVALLLFDLDGFKRINDLHGHGAGDRLLGMVASRLRENLDEHCTLAHFSGGTFALLEQCHAHVLHAGSGPVSECATLVHRAFEQPYDLGDDTHVVISVSLGEAWLDPHAESPDVVLKQAELALYQAKADGRGLSRRFNPGMQEDFQYQEALIEELRRAAIEGSLDMHAQPQTDQQGHVLGAELLLRWTRANGESVSPGVFIPLAERSDLILLLGDWVLHQACQQLVAWSGKPVLGDLTLAVNVSARQFQRAGFVRDVCDVLARTGADPHRLTLEITESVVLGKIDEAASRLSRLRALGIRISLDDFGTGFSSLSYLSRLPIDEIKIDQSFVADLPDDANDAMLARTIIAMGRGLGMQVVAEGVETEAQLAFLRREGCHAFQGYLLARPMPMAAMRDWLQARSPMPSGHVHSD